MIVERTTGFEILRRDVATLIEKWKRGEITAVDLHLLRFAFGLLDTHSPTRGDVATAVAFISIAANTAPLPEDEVA